MVELAALQLHPPQQQVDCLGRHDWPGNIRELKNVIERAVILSGGRQLRLDLAMPEDEQGVPLARSTQSAALSADRTTEATFLTDAELREQERANMIAVLDDAGWRISGPGGAAELLGVKPSTLAYRMKSFAIEKSVELSKDSNRR